MIHIQLYVFMLCYKIYYIRCKYTYILNTYNEYILICWDLKKGGSYELKSSKEIDFSICIIKLLPQWSTMQTLTQNIY